MSDTNPLLNNQSVQGAAKSIEGLMDTKGVIKKPQKEAAPVEPKEEVEAKAETETEVEQQAETQQEETQEVAEQEEASQDENAIEEQTTDLHQVTVNGEKCLMLWATDVGGRSEVIRMQVGRARGARAPSRARRSRPPRRPRARPSHARRQVPCA